MTCSPSLLKLLGIKLAMELTKPKVLSEQRLFQAIIVQALEDWNNVTRTTDKSQKIKWKQLTATLCVKLSPIVTVGH